jgi:hypothetical protein
MSNYYDRDFDPWARGIRNIGTMIMQQPMLRAQAEQRSRQAQLTGAQTEQAGARTRLLDAQTEELVRKGQLVTMLERSAPAAERAFAEGRLDDPSINDFTGAASALTGVNKGDIQKSMKQGIGTMLSRMGQVDEAAAVQNPNAVQKVTADNATRETIAGAGNTTRLAIADRLNASREGMARERGVTLQPGAVLLKDGAEVYRNPSAAAQSQSDYETTTEIFPAMPGSEGLPERTEGSLWWKKQLPATEGTPGTPERRVTTRRKLSDVAAPATPAATNAPPTDITAPGGVPQVATNALPQVRTQADVDRVMAEANRAIAAGKDPAAVKARLREMGIQILE